MSTEKNTPTNTNQTNTNIEELLASVDQQLLVRLLDTLIKEQAPELAAAKQKAGK